MPRPLRRSAGAALAICTLTGALTAATAAAPSATARSNHRHVYTVLAHAKRTADAKVTSRSTMTAAVTAKVTVPGHPAVSAKATASGTATTVGAARASVTARGAGAAPVRSVAAAKARTRAVARATRRSHAAAVALAKRRAAASARTLAQSRAVAAAKKKAVALAAAAAAKLSPASGSTPPTTTAPTPPATTDPPTTDPVAPPTGPVAPPADPGPPSTGSDTSCGGVSLTKTDGSAWTCTFDDEFDGTTLDRSKWTVQTTAGSGFGNSNQSCYLDDPGNVSVADGVLRLTALKLSAPMTCSSSPGDFKTQYTAGSVNGWNKFAQTYGRFEVRAKLPAATVAGLQETLWLWPVNQFTYGAWPLSGEIDFGEFYSANAGWNIPYLHYGVQQSTINWTSNTNVVTALPAPYAQPGMNCRIDQSGFNTYTLLWEPGRLTISINGQDCIVNNYQALGLASPAPFDQAFFLALTQGIGQGANAPGVATPFPATTEVDYVRIWK